MIALCHYFTILMTVQLPMIFQLTWLSIFMCVLWTSILQYIGIQYTWSTIVSIWPLITWHDMTLLTWIAWWCGNVKSLLLLSVGCLIRYALSTPLHALVVWSLQWSLVLDGSCKLVALLISLGWSTCEFRYNRFLRNVSFLLLLVHHLSMTG